MATKTNCTKAGKSYYRIAITLGRNSEGKLIRKEFYGSSKKDAESKRDKYLNSVNNGLDKKYDKKTLGKTMNLWLNQYVKQVSKPSTYDRYLGIYRNYITSSPIYSSTISEIKPLEIQSFYNSLYEKGKTSSTINSINKLLKSFFTFSYNQSYTTNNPCSGKKVIIPGNLQSERKKVEIFSDNDLRKIIYSSEDSTIKSLAIFSLSTGMRRGECLGLKWKDIKDNEITISRSCKTVAIYDGDNKKFKPILQTPKTSLSNRTINLPSGLFDVIKSIKKQQIENKLKSGGSYIENDLVFCNEIGALLDDSNISRSFKRFLKRSDIEYKKFHALRHTYATKQFELDVPLKTVSYCLGHSNINITANTYTHVLKQHRDKTVDILKII